MAIIVDTKTISFNEIHFETPTSVATKMRKEIIKFFEENPNEKIELHFGEYARLSSKFTEELFKDGLLNKYQNQMITREMHVFDGVKIKEALDKHK